MAWILVERTVGAPLFTDTSIPDGQCALVDPARGFATPTPTENINSQRRAMGSPQAREALAEIARSPLWQAAPRAFSHGMYHASYVSEA
jgi:hypothetical protein